MTAAEIGTFLGTVAVYAVTAWRLGTKASNAQRTACDAKQSADAAHDRLTLAGIPHKPDASAKTIRGIQVQHRDHRAKK